MRERLMTSCGHDPDDPDDPDYHDDPDDPGDPNDHYFLQCSMMFYDVL